MILFVTGVGIVDVSIGAFWFYERPIDVVAFSKQWWYHKNPFFLVSNINISDLSILVQREEE